MSRAPRVDRTTIYVTAAAGISGVVVPPLNSGGRPSAAVAIDFGGRVLELDLTLDGLSEMERVVVELARDLRREDAAARGRRP